MTIDENISLRLFTEKDAEEFYDLTMASKTYLKEWLGWLDTINSVNDTLKNIHSRINEMKQHKGFPLGFAIIYQGKIAGTIGFNTIDRKNKIGTIGYWLGEQYQGRGIATKSFESMILYGFNNLNLNRIEVRVATENYQSRALPERYSFKAEGVIRDAEWLYCRYVDHTLYSLLKNEYESYQ